MRRVDPLDRLCARLARRRAIERAIARVAPACAIAGLAGATALTVVRLAVPGVAWAAPAVAVATLLAPCLVLPAALRRRDPPWLLAAHADRCLAADGLAMALAAQPAAARDPAWLARLAPALAAVRLPTLRLPGAGAAIAALAVAAAAWWLPQTAPAAPAAPVIGATLREAGQRLDELARDGLAPPEELHSLEERLAAVREAAAQRGLDQQTWAAADALDRDLEAAKARAADRLADALAKAEALGALAADAGAEAASRAAADLAAALADLQRDAPGLAAKLPPGAAGQALLRLAQQAAAGAELSEAQRAELRKWGLDPAQAGKPMAGDAAAAKALADRLAADLAAADRRAAAAGEGKGPGGPGADAQPGHSDNDPGDTAPLTWGEGQRVAGGYRDKLASGDPRSPEAGALVGTQSRAPREDETATAETGRAGAVDHAAAAADARAATVPPRHSAAVARYFAAGTAPSAPAPAPAPLP